MMMMTMWQKLDSKALVNLRLCPIAVVEAAWGGGAGAVRKGGHGRVLKIHLNNKARPYANQGGGGYVKNLSPNTSDRVFPTHRIPPNCTLTDKKWNTY
jgi:hypothetical protein